ncbi:MAG TPA: chemotaxis protein CheW [Nannocystaceae bacterium]|jgi:purine-binding chemotaxis protein CheW|nr:chemotaxis protein CheW [Nannocystaceae bacterium]
MTTERHATADATARTAAERLRLLRERAEASETRTAERDAAVLAERARLLAKPVAASSAADVVEAITLRLAKELYAIEASAVLEAVTLTELAPLPGAIPPVFAVTVWRGELLLLLDVRRALGLTSAALSDLRHVVVLAGDEGPVGILVDEIVGVTSLSLMDVRPLSPESPSDVVRGVTPSAIVVLEPSALTRLSH